MPGLIHHHAVIHPKAHVARDECFIGAGTKVWQFASVIRGARLGEDCTVGAGAIIDGAQIGDRCIIGAGAQIHPGMKIGNDVFVGPGAIFCNDVWPSVSKEGFDYEGLGKDGNFAVVVDDKAMIGAASIIMPGVHIGMGAMISAGAKVMFDVPPFSLYTRANKLGRMAGAEHELRMRWAS